MKIDNDKIVTKVVATIKQPKFEKFPILAISIGGDGFKKFGWTRGKNYGIVSLFGFYITFRLPYKKEEVWSQGVEDGFKGAKKTIAYLTSHIDKQNAVIASLLANSEIFEDGDDEDDDDGFNPLWN
jgi:hypothetical protein